MRVKVFTSKVLFFALILGVCQPFHLQASESSDKDRVRNEFERKAQQVDKERDDTLLSGLLLRERALLALIESVSGEVRARLEEGESAEDLVDLFETSQPKQSLETYRRDIARLQKTAGTGMQNSYIAELERLVEVLAEATAARHDLTAEQERFGEHFLTLEKSIRAMIESSLTTGEYFDIGNGTGSTGTKKWSLITLAKQKEDFVRYGRVKEVLLKTAKPRQLERMYTADQDRALLIYDASNYRLAVLLLEAAIEMYRNHGLATDDATFLLAESHYRLHASEKAKALFDKLLQAEPRLQPKALFRLMTIAVRDDDAESMYTLHDRLVTSGLYKDANYGDRCLYLAGYTFLEDRNPDAARQAFSKIIPSSSLFDRAQFLIGIAAMQQGESKTAVSVFSDLMKGSQAPKAMRSAATWRLAYLQYELGNFADALETTRAASLAHADGDKALLLRAWTNFKLGNHEAALTAVNELQELFGHSPYVYEGLTLAAHIRDVTEGPGTANDELRYVSNGRKIYDISDRLYSERIKVEKLLEQLTRLEHRALSNEDFRHYLEIQKQRAHLTDLLAQLQTATQKGYVFFEEINRERRHILSQIDELTDVIENSESEEVRVAASKTQIRLTNILKSMEDLEPVKSDYHLQYPLAAKESHNAYLQRLISDLRSDAEAEAKKLERDLEEIERMRNKYTGSEVILDEIDIRIAAMREAANRLRAWVKMHEARPAVRTDFNTLADFSGFAMSDSALIAMNRREQLIAELARKNDIINRILRGREAERLREKLRNRLENEESRLQETTEAIEKEHEKKSRYFSDQYFDESVREVDADGSGDKAPDNPETSEKVKEQE